MRIEDALSISPGFQRSINLRYDLNDIDKIQSYIPTIQSEQAFSEILSSLNASNKERAYQVVGTYGSGKSHFAVTLGSLLGKEVPKSSFSLVSEKIRDEFTKKLFETEVEKEKPFLVVPIASIYEDPDSAILYSIKTCLSEKNLDLLVRSNHETALTTIDKWEKEFPKVYEELNNALLASGSCLEDLNNSLKRYEKEALNWFIDIYPELSAGASFDGLQGDLSMIVEDVARNLPRHGYRGIVFICDEFNKFIETSIVNEKSLKSFQDIAELANRSGDGFDVLLIVISHKAVSQYFDDIENEWVKVEGRFKTLNLSNTVHQTYDLMSRVFIIKNNDVVKQLTKKKECLVGLEDYPVLKDMFTGWSIDQFEDQIIEGCLLLHPASVFLLPRMSNLLAQNERTLFSFLAGKDDSPLTSLMKCELSDFKLVYPDEIYDYFNEAMKFSKDVNVMSAWHYANNALTVLQDKCYQDILKTVALFNACGGKVQPTIDLVVYSLKPKYKEEEIKNALDTLAKQQWLYINLSDDVVVLTEPVDLDIDERVDKWFADNFIQVNIHDIATTNVNGYVVPYKYNFQKAITRFLTPVYADLNHLENIIYENDIQYLDGAIIYLFPETNHERLVMRELIRGCNKREFVFVLPKKPLSFREKYTKLLALRKIKEEIKKESRGDKVQVIRLIEMRIRDAQKELYAIINCVIEPSSNMEYFWKGILQNDIVSGTHLSRLASKLMEDLYYLTPKINNELINKQEVTPITKRAMRNVLDSLFAKQSSDISSSQETFIYDSVFIQTGLLPGKTESLFNINLCNSTNEVLKIIDEFLKTSKSESQCLSKLIDTLVEPPYGLRKGVLPAFFYAGFDRYKNEIIIVMKEENAECKINSDLLFRVTEEPEKYAVELDNWNKFQEQLVAGLAEIFSINLVTIDYPSNILIELGQVMFQWFVGLPRYTRETDICSEDAKILMEILEKVEKRPREVLLKELPNRYGTVQYDNRELNELLKRVKVATKELEDHIFKLRKNIKYELEQFFYSLGINGTTLQCRANSLKSQIPIDSGSSIEWIHFNEFIQTFSGTDIEFINGVAKALTGVDLEDWQDTTIMTFKGVLQSLLELKKDKNKDEYGTRVEIKVVDVPNIEQSYILPVIELSELGRMLQSHVESSLADFGDAITSLEKRQVLLNVLKNLLGDE